MYSAQTMASMSAAQPVSRKRVRDHTFSYPQHPHMVPLQSQNRPQQGHFIFEITRRKSHRPCTLMLEKRRVVYDGRVLFYATLYCNFSETSNGMQVLHIRDTSCQLCTVMPVGNSDV